MDSAMGHPASPGRGCPIRRSPDHSLLAAPRGLSQPSTSFIGSWCQGIHRAPLLARRLDLSTSPSRQDQRSQKNLAYRPVRSQLGMSAERLYFCLLNYSSILQVRTTSTRAAPAPSASRGASTNLTLEKVEPPRPALHIALVGHKNGSTSVEPPPKSVMTRPPLPPASAHRRYHEIFCSRSPEACG